MWGRAGIGALTWLVLSIRSGGVWVGSGIGVVKPVISRAASATAGIVEGVRIRRSSLR
jgi:hypothetical protein